MGLKGQKRNGTQAASDELFEHGVNILFMEDIVF